MKALIFALLAAAMFACAPPDRPAPESPDWPFAGRAVVTETPHAMVVSGHPIASQVGRSVLEEGGNAVDAAVAVGFALAVVHSEAGNIGGGGFMVIRLAQGAVSALDFRETAPAAASHDMFLDSQGRPTNASQIGYLASGVPGSVAGLAEAHSRYGKLPWARLVEPSVRLARDGFVIDAYRRSAITDERLRLSRFDATRAIFLPGGQPPPVGYILRQPELARTLAAIRDSGAAGFYRGWVADSLAADMRRNGGLITRDDLQSYRPIWRNPIVLDYRRYTIYTMPPPSSGGVTMGEILNVMEGLQPMPSFGSVSLMHVEAEAMRRAFMDRNRFLGDPAFVQNPVARLLAKSYADSLRQSIDRARATPTPPFNALTGGPSTTHFSIVDTEGNAVSCTTTLNDSYGSAVVVRGAGFLLNNEMDDFSVVPGLPNLYGLVQGEANAIAPGKRMLSAMTPSIVLAPTGELFLILGTPGGPTIITQVYEVISNVIDHRMSLAEAVDAPRLHHQALPDSLRLERGGFPRPVIDSLRSMGHAIEFDSPWGDVEAIMVTPRSLIGVSDPRRGGGGAGY